MSIVPVDFKTHKIKQSFLGNGSNRVFYFTDIPALEKEDIQIYIYNKTNKVETLINFIHFTTNINK